MNKNQNEKRRLLDHFANPSWLAGNKLTNKRRALSIPLVVLLIVYAFDWGLSTERAIQCLANGNVPTGRWIDNVSGWKWMSGVTIIVSATVLIAFTWRNPLRLLRTRHNWKELAIVGIAWALPLFLTRAAALFTPETPCQQGAPNQVPPFFAYEHLSGPAEEIWFAAIIAVWMLMWADRPKIKLTGILAGGAILRGIFHVYQGWESVGLFIWGAAAALAVAITGRWIILFLLHYANNALIMTSGIHNVLVSMALLSIVTILYWTTQPKKQQQTPTSDSNMNDATHEK